MSVMNHDDDQMICEAQHDSITGIILINRTRIDTQSRPKSIGKRVVQTTAWSCCSV
jgi:hypothetical protein